MSGTPERDRKARRAYHQRTIQIGSWIVTAVTMQFEPARSRVEEPDISDRVTITNRGTPRSTALQSAHSRTHSIHRVQMVHVLKRARYYGRRECA